MNRKLNPGKAFANALDNIVFFIAAIVLFLKTSEVLSEFAPQAVFGYAAVDWLYGYICALLIEGLLIAAKFTLAGNQNSNAWLWNVLVIVVTFAISAAAQVVDGFMVKQTLTLQPMPVQFLITWGVPLVPSVILALVLGKAVFASLPEGSAEPKAEKIQRSSAPVQAPRQFAAEASAVVVRKNDLTAEDKDFIATHSTRQVMAKFGVIGRTARDWRLKAKRGNL